MNNSPVLLYLSVVALTCLMALRIEGRRNSSNIKVIKPFAFFMSFLIPGLFIAFTDTGTDYYSYYEIIERTHTLRDLIDDVNTEPVFTLWSTIGWSLFKNPHLIILTMKIGSLIALFSCFYILKNEIDLFLAFLSYVSIIYFVSFYLISINLAACFICLAIAFIITNRFTKGLVFAILACGIHYSAFLALFPILAYKFIFLFNKKNTISHWRILIVFVGIIVAMYGFFNIVDSLISSYDQFQHYGKYVDDLNNNKSKGLGIVQFLFYSPIIYILYKMYFQKNYSRQLFTLFLLFSFFGFACAEIGYIIPIFNRTYFIYFPVFCIILPYYVNSLRLNAKTENGISFWRQVRAIAFVYFLCRLYFTFSESIRQDSTSALYFYHYFNPFTSN